jgi:hypothetical protein
MSDILVCCGLENADPLFAEYRIFRHALDVAEVKPVFREISDSASLVEELNLRKPKILEFFGHAGYDSKTRTTSLFFGREQCKISSLLSRLQQGAMPDVVMLIGCETASCDAFAGTAANEFLQNGARAVVATLLPVYGDFAGYFAGRLLFNLKQYPEARLDGLVYSTKNGMWVNEQIDSLLYNGSISKRDWMSLWHDYITDNAMKKLDFAEFAAYYKIRARFCEMLEDKGLYSNWAEIQHSIVPHSLFFALIGLGHTLRIRFR